MTQFFSLSAPREKLSHFDLKSWVAGGIKILPIFLGQNESIFSLSAPREKLRHFDPKSWVTGGTKIWPNFLGQNDWIFRSVHRENNWVILTLKVESQAELKFDLTF